MTIYYFYYLCLPLLDYVLILFLSFIATVAFNLFSFKSNFYTIIRDFFFFGVCLLNNKHKEIPHELCISLHYKTFHLLAWFPRPFIVLDYMFSLQFYLTNFHSHPSRNPWFLKLMQVADYLVSSCFFSFFLFFKKYGIALYCTPSLIEGQFYSHKIC